MEQIVIDEDNSAAVKDFIRKGVMDYNYKYLGKQESKTFACYTKDNNGNIIGGITGEYSEGVNIRINWAWVDEKHRKAGLGTKLFQALEKFAGQKKCNDLQVDTLSFQAKGFYEKLGFQVVTTLPEWVKNYDLHVMRKRLK